MAARRFGTLSDGTDIEEVTIGAGELTVKVITLGAVIRDVRLAGIGHPLVLGFDGLDDYVNHSPHFGALPADVPIAPVAAGWSSTVI